jgi:hypothetical protein
MENSKKLILLSENDNVLVACQNIGKGELLKYRSHDILVKQTISLGHKIAARDIKAGEKIIKFNVPIGSAKGDIKKGEHVHVHNMKSDFIPTYTIENQEKYK